MTAQVKGILFLAGSILIGAGLFLLPYINLMGFGSLRGDVTFWKPGEVVRPIGVLYWIILFSALFNTLYGFILLSGDQNKLGGVISSILAVIGIVTLMYQVINGGIDTLALFAVGFWAIWLGIIIHLAVSISIVMRASSMAEGLSDGETEISSPDAA